MKKQMRWLTWRRAGWVLSCMTALAGLAIMLYVAWITRHGHPRGPAGAIVAGFLMYAGITLRLIGGASLLLFKPARTTLAIIVWAIEMSALWWFDLPPYSWQARTYFLVWCGGACLCDVWLLSSSRKSLL